MNRLIGKGTYGNVFCQNRDSNTAKKIYSLFDIDPKSTEHDSKTTEFNGIAIREMIFCRYSEPHENYTRVIRMGHDNSEFFMSMLQRGINLKIWLNLARKKVSGTSLES